MTYADGRKYDGPWVKGKMEGHGVETWPDGDVYDGAFVGNKREGQGKMTYSDGEVHDGIVLVFLILLFLFPFPLSPFFSTGSWRTPPARQIRRVAR